MKAIDLFPRTLSHNLFRTLAVGVVAASIGCAGDTTDSDSTDSKVVAVPVSCEPVVARIPSATQSWFVAGNDPNAYAMQASQVARITSRSDLSLDHFGTLMKTVDAGPFRGRSVRFTATAAASSVTGKGGLWMRVDGPHGVLAFDNMQNRPITGTTPARPYEVLLRVPADAVSVNFGLLLSGAGDIWAGHAALEIVENDAPNVLDASAWQPAGSNPAGYEIGQDAQVQRCARPSAKVASRAGGTQGFGTAMFERPADDYRGKRVRLSGWVKTANVSRWAGLWMRVDGADQVLAFDNMQSRPIVGTTEWTRYETVLDVAPSAVDIAFGLLVVGDGTGWVDNVKLEVASAPIDVIVPFDHAASPDAPAANENVSLPSGTDPTP